MPHSLHMILFSQVCCGDGANLEWRVCYTGLTVLIVYDPAHKQLRRADTYLIASRWDFRSRCLRPLNVRDCCDSDIDEFGFQLSEQGYI